MATANRATARRWLRVVLAMAVVGVVATASQSQGRGGMAAIVDAATGGALEVSSSALDFGTQGLGSSSATQTITLTNSGASTLTFSGPITISPDSADPRDFTEQDTCGSLAPGAQCVIGVRFTPTHTGPRAATLTLPDTTSGAPHGVALSGSGSGIDPAALTVSASTLDFGTQPLTATNPPRPLTLTNTGLTPLSIYALTLYYHDFQLIDGCTGLTLAPGDSCTAYVGFSPSSVGYHTDVLAIDSGLASGPLSVVLSGTATGPASTTSGQVSTATLDLGTQVRGTTGATQTVTFTNTGATMLNVWSIVPATGDSNDVTESDTCQNQSLPPGGSCVISVAFTPQQSGLRAALFTINDDTDSVPLSFVASGIGSGTTASTLTPSALQFGSQVVGSAGATQTVTLTNSGTTPLTVASVSLSGSDAGDFVESDACAGQTLAVGASCSAQVGFAPGATGPRAATLRISDSAQSSPLGVALDGIGTSPPLAFSAALLDFGSQTVGTTSISQTVVITNDSATTVTMEAPTRGGAAPNDYSDRSTCPVGSLAPGSSCTIDLAFTPSGAGTRPATLSVTSVVMGTVVAHAVQLTGVGVSPLPTATATDSPTATATDTPTATATATILPTDSATAIPTSTATATAIATVTATDSPTATTTALPTDTATAQPTPTATATATVSPTSRATVTALPTSTAIASRTGTATVTDTSTARPTSTAIAPPTDTATARPTSTATASPTTTATHASYVEALSADDVSPTRTATATATAAPTSTATATATATAIAAALPIPIATRRSYPSVPVTSGRATAIPSLILLPSSHGTLSLLPTPVPLPPTLVLSVALARPNTIVVGAPLVVHGRVRPHTPVSVTVTLARPSPRSILRQHATTGAHIFYAATVYTAAGATGLVTLRLPIAYAQKGQNIVLTVRLTTPYGHTSVMAIVTLTVGTREPHTPLRHRKG